MPKAHTAAKANELSDDPWSVIGSFLSTADLARANQVNKAAAKGTKKISKVARFKQHFPEEYARLKAQHAGLLASAFWHAEFKRQYQASYKTLKPRDKDLLLAVKEGDLAKLKKLALSHDELHQSIQGLPLHLWASLTKHQHILDYLYEKATHFYTQGHAVDLQKQDAGGRTCLHWAAAFNQMEILKLLLNQGAGIEVKTNNGATALFMAAQQGHGDMVQQLLASGANINAACTDGATALYIAAQNGHSNIVQQLLGRVIN